ncbi:unnamed protein product [Trichobilharzia szidati]|nr:unnamed protein product [Trichobilharzia szidati]
MNCSATSTQNIRLDSSSNKLENSQESNQQDVLINSHKFPLNDNSDAAAAAYIDHNDKMTEHLTNDAGTHLVPAIDENDNSDVDDEDNGDDADNETPHIINDENSDKNNNDRKHDDDDDIDDNDNGIKILLDKQQNATHSKLNSHESKTSAALNQKSSAFENNSPVNQKIIRKIDKQTKLTDEYVAYNSNFGHSEVDTLKQNENYKHEILFKDNFDKNITENNKSINDICYEQVNRKKVEQDHCLYKNLHTIEVNLKNLQISDLHKSASSLINNKSNGKVTQPDLIDLLKSESMITIINKDQLTNKKENNNIREQNSPNKGKTKVQHYTTKHTLGNTMKPIGKTKETPIQQLDGIKVYPVMSTATTTTTNIKSVSSTSQPNKLYDQQNYRRVNHRQRNAMYSNKRMMSQINSEKSTSNRLRNKSIHRRMKDERLTAKHHQLSQHNNTEMQSTSSTEKLAATNSIDETLTTMPAPPAPLVKSPPPPPATTTTTKTRTKIPYVNPDKLYPCPLVKSKHADEWRSRLFEADHRNDHLAPRALSSNDSQYQRSISRCQDLLNQVIKNTPTEYADSLPNIKRTKAKLTSSYSDNNQQKNEFENVTPSDSRYQLKCNLSTPQGHQRDDDDADGGHFDEQLASSSYFSQTKPSDHRDPHPHQQHVRNNRTKNISDKTNNYSETVYGRWFDVNDDYIIEIDPMTFHKVFEGPECAYMLFYRLHSLPMPV